MTRSSSESGSHKTDIMGRPEIVKLVEAFYTRVRADATLGHVFDSVAKVDWVTHLPKICDFWDTVLFRAGTYRGNPLAAHAKLLAETDMSWPLFERWLELFRAAVDEMFAGENAEHIVRCAEDMAKVIHSKIHSIPNPRFDPERLIPGQKALHASYQETSAK